MNLLSKLDFPPQTLTNDILHRFSVYEYEYFPAITLSPHAQIAEIINNGFSHKASV